MARTIHEAPLTTRAARLKLKVGRQAHWRTIVPGRAALGYRRKTKNRAGTWLLRRYVDGAYRVTPLGTADDFDAADGDRVLSFAEADKKANTVAEGGVGRPVYRLTVRRALADYIEFKLAEGTSARSINDTERRAAAHILPTLGDKEVAELTAATLRRWLANLAASPAMKRSKILKKD